MIPSDGGFAGLFRLDFDGKLFARNYSDPVLVSGTDGVGTKLKKLNRHRDIKPSALILLQCVSMISSARELNRYFFLDYVAMGKR